MIGIKEEINEFSSPLLAAAIHNGHEIRPGIKRYLEIDEYTRLREEDPCTECFTDVAENRLIIDTSRFEVDLNRSRDEAIYRLPEQSWGLKVWKDEVPLSVWEYSLGEYEYFYSHLSRVISRIIDYWGYIVVYDIHSYNYRREEGGEKEADPKGNPDINLGTGSLDRHQWGLVVDTFIEAVKGYEYPERKLHIAENVRFKGGYFGKWIHNNFPGRSCVISIEFKKIFMDEWTAAVDIMKINLLKKVLKATKSPVLEAAEAIKVKLV